jgi:hypothetical protein
MARVFRHTEKDHVHDYDRVGGWTPAAIPVGLTIALLGMWVLFVPLVGPYFDFGFYTEETWQFGEMHWTLSIAPGLAAAIAGVLMILPTRIAGWILGLVATLAGAWLIVGPSLYPLWTEAEIDPIGGSEGMMALMWIGYYYGPGAIIVFLSGLNEGLLSRRRRTGTRIVEQTTIDEPVTAEREPPLSVGG